MEWLKDKKNLPIVAGLAGVVLLGMIGLILFELGVFPSGSSASTPAAPVAVASGPAASGYPGGGYPGGGSPYPGGSSGYPGSAGGYPGSAPRLAAGGATAKTTAANPAPMVNPMVGADPFALPQPKALTRAAIRKAIAAVRVPISAVVPAYNLFAIRPPRVEAPPAFELPDQSGSSQMLASTRVSGIVNADDGIFAIVEMNGDSQTVKPGDKLLDGSKVASIQATGITLHTPSGAVLSLPLSSGVPAAAANSYGYGGGGGYPGGGYPGGFGGYPGGGFGGYPGGGGFGGYPGGDAGGGYPGGG